MGYYTGNKIKLSRKWKDARPEIQSYLDDMHDCCIELGVSTGLAENLYVSTFWGAGVSIICEVLIVVLTDNTVKWSLDSGLNWFVVYSPTGLSVPEAGMVTEYGGDENNVPTGWLLCDGEAVSRTTYASLFSAISTTYGVGDGSTTFNLPDTRAKAVLGVNVVGYPNSNDVTLATRNIADIVGAEGHTLIESELPAHIHATNASGSRNSRGGTGGYAGAGTSASTSTGGDGSHNNIQPSYVINYLIKT